jgi:hypothetical protein
VYLLAVLILVFVISKIYAGWKVTIKL